MIFVRSSQAFQIFGCLRRNPVRTNSVVFLSQTSPFSTTPRHSARAGFQRPKIDRRISKMRPPLSMSPFLFSQTKNSLVALSNSSPHPLLPGPSPYSAPAQVLPSSWPSALDHSTRRAITLSQATHRARNRSGATV